MKKPTHGLSSLELIVALGLLIMISGFMMNSFIMAARAGSQATKKNVLSSLAREKAAIIRNSTFDEVLALPNSGNFAPPHEDYSFELTLSSVAGQDPALVTAVEIRVAHPKKGTKTVRTLKSKLPDLDPGELAFRKYACDQCHTLSAAGYTYDPDPANPRIPLDRITERPGLPNDDGTMPPPLSFADEAAMRTYIAGSILSPTAIDRYESTGQDEMAVALYDEGGYVDSTEVNALTDWLAGFSNFGASPP